MLLHSERVGAFLDKPHEQVYTLFTMCTDREKERKRERESESERERERERGERGRGRREEGGGRGSERDRDRRERDMAVRRIEKLFSYDRSNFTGAT